ncbi:MAG: bifunctional folylpolyglutamate synthase/dihydrofolate synthase [Candidatus Hydrogenedentes bacterium]|nr:bifunctional folylpolyglutamate synthase/dihydrofolate synthase [Candidatus Hydrogenedentota bacterium]
MNPRDYLDGLHGRGIKFGLDNIRFLLDAAGQPHTRFPCVHVGGTNGKGSVVAMLHAMARAAGYRVARFTSPHLIRLNERIVVDDACIDDASLDGHLAAIRRDARAMDHAPTYFEAVTAAAFRQFADAHVDLALIEVGMGGRHDATNVILPEVAAITSIDFEHMQYLGDTLGQIASEKAGILKPDVPAVVADLCPEAREVVLARAAELDCPVAVAGRDFSYALTGGPFAREFAYESASCRLGPVRLGLNASFQGENAAIAVAVAERLSAAFPRIDAAAMESGLRTARWPCRLERVIESPPVIVDVAHNPAGARKLAAELPECVVVLAVSADKAAAGIIDALRPIARRLILTQYAYDRRMPLDALCAAAQASRAAYERAASLPDAIALGLESASDAVPLLITGSIFTAGEARTVLAERYGAPLPAF